MIKYAKINKKYKRKHLARVTIWHFLIEYKSLLGILKQCIIKMKQFLLVLVFLTIFLLEAVVANAEGFAVTDFSARGTGLAGGMVGRANDPSAVAYNPAGITQLPGTQLMLGTTLNMPQGSVETRDASGTITTTDANKKIWPAPNIYGTYQANDSVWLGFGLFSRFGIGIGYPSDWPGRYSLVDVTLQTVSFNPNIAFKLTDKLSLAFGLDFMYASMEMNRDIPVLTNIISMSLEGDSTELGFNAALHYIFNDQWQAGLSYRSAVTQSVEGDVVFTKQVPATGLVDSGVKGELFLPDSISFGLNYNPSPVWNFEAGFVHTFWSKYSDLDIHLDSGLSLLSKKSWNDTWLLNISAEYQALDWVALRGGYSYETNAVNKEYSDYMTPSYGRYRLHTGIGFAWDSWKLDMAYSYVSVIDLDHSYSKVAGVAGSGIKSKDTASHVVGLAVSYIF